MTARCRFRCSQASFFKSLNYSCSSNNGLKQPSKPANILLLFPIRGDPPHIRDMRSRSYQFYIFHRCKHKMISVESHSKQIKLLNDYILALEKQVASARKENQEHNKNVAASSDDLKKMNEEINRLRNQIGQLRFNNVRQDDVIRKLAPLQREVNQGRESIQKLAVQNNRLNSVIQQIQENNRALEERGKNAENELKSKTEMFGQESYRNKQEIEELKKALNEKIKQNEDITLVFNTEKKNLAARVTALETNNAQLAKVKNQTISRQSKELDELKARYSKDMTSNSQARNSLGDQIKQLVSNSNENQAKIGSLTKELNQTKQLLENKSIQAEATAGKLALKIDEYDNLVKRTNEEKNNLLKNIQRLEDERKRLEAVNNACKGDISENTKALSDALKKGEQLNTKLFQANQELSKRYDLIVQSQDEITRLNNLVKQLNKDIANRTQETKVRESYITMLKSEISTANSKIQQLQEVKSSNLSNLGQLDQTANKLRKELASAKAEIKDNERVIDDKNVLLTKRVNQIHNLELVVKDHQFTISKLTTDLENRNETIKNLNSGKEQLEKNLEEAKNVNELLTDVKAQLQKDLDTLKAYSSNIQKEKAELSTNLSQIMKEKMGDKDLLTRQLSSRDKKILELNNKYEKLESLSNQQSKNNAQAIKKLQAEKLSLSVQISEANNEVEAQKKKLEQLQANFVKTKENLQSLTQQYNSYRKRKEVEVEELTNQLKESQKKNEKKTAKIEELNQEIQVLEDSHTNHRKSLGDSLKEEMQRQKAKFNKTILELKGEHDDLINKKNVEKEQLRQQLQKAKEELEEKYKSSIQQWSAKEKNLNQLIKRSQEEKKLLEKEVSRLNFSTITESQSKTSKELQIQALKKSIERMEMYSKEQKNAIDQLTKLIDSKSKEIETIEQSNAMLRKQVISALSHQETSRKELIETKSRGSVVITSSKHDMRGSNVPNGTRSQLLTKKKTIFSNKQEVEPRTSINERVLKKQLTEKMKFSLVEDLNDSNFAERYD